MLGGSEIIGYVKCNWLAAPTILAVKRIEAENLQLKFTGVLHWFCEGEDLELGVYSVFGTMDLLDVKTDCTQLRTAIQWDASSTAGQKKETR